MMVPRPLRVFLVILMLGMLVTGKVTRARTAVLAGVACWLLTTAVFICAGQLAGHRAGERAGEELPHGNDARSHGPLADAREPADAGSSFLRSRTGTHTCSGSAMLSLAPSWMPAADCPSRSLDARTTPSTALTQSASRNRPSLQWLRRSSSVSYRAGPRLIRRATCQAAGLHAFRSRALDCETMKKVGGLADLRVQPGAFRWLLRNSTLEPTSRRCPSHVPPWTPPRADILGP